MVILDRLVMSLSQEKSLLELPVSLRFPTAYRLLPPPGGAEVTHSLAVSPATVIEPLAQYRCPHHEKDDEN